jgi:catechol 2,3-dioxygenase-like lactoylglutathione lyase family enzyme
VQSGADAIYMRGAGGAPFIHVTQAGPSNKALGFGLYAKSEEDLAWLADRVGSKVTPNEEPGGGNKVRFTDPSGFVVDVLHGQAVVEPMPHREPTRANHARARQRLNQPVRLAAQPSSVLRLGHALMMVADLRATLDFYGKTLGFRTSDSYWGGVPDNTVAAFMHCGLGRQWTDHHTLAFVQAQDGVSRMDHSAFEVVDLDDVVQGGSYLLEKGYKRSWGVGRHVQGSQVFDYWRDPAGNKIEHWTDGDMVNDDSPVGSAPMSPEGLSQWGPPVTPDFFA